MPNFERNLRQNATYWAPVAEDAFGKRTYASPVTLPCRWEDKAELFISKLGAEERSRSKVFFAQNLALDGYLYLGSSVNADPLAVTGALEIRMVFRTPDLRNNKQLYVAML